jgi:hypothetical protein
MHTVAIQLTVCGHTQTSIWRIVAIPVSYSDQRRDHPAAVGVDIGCAIMAAYTSLNAKRCLIP